MGTQLANQDPKFCIITPTEYLETYAAQSSMHLVLAHLVDSAQRYADFYASRSELKIMDNSAFELGASYDPDKLLDLARKCKADAIVLPDYPGQDPSLTIEAAIKYAPIFKEAGFKTMFVPQSEVGDINGWLEAYEWAVLDNELVDIVGMSILGIPNALPKIHKAYARVVMTAMLIDANVFDFTKHHHYLGLNSGPNLEIPSLIGMNALGSCDSSGPVWAAIHGQRYDTRTDSFMRVNKTQLPHVDFQFRMLKDDDNRHGIIQHNIDKTLELFKKGAV